ncbi:glycosyltransferase involved in cell wall biosynthesis [Crenobacter luteus]|uniref:glycosyltransferase family 2 protein n=1 Tax=Crenobacter luteus TaxID=1452487 RepID=UPI00104A12A1|nr:glycosyltransferase family 2 protein [Crenobacter luteus]TCP13086.1 glycosyltransferase involved in cell wall biosynthesis [Crenobacter luteus]
MAPLVSIILPTFNDRTYLGATIAAVLAQSHDNFELIVVDDGSSDGSDLIYLAAARSDARVRHIRQANQGLSAARNTGLSLARGELIAFLDSDDLLHPDFLHVLVHTLQAETADVVVCQPDVFSDGQQPAFTQVGTGELVRLDGPQAVGALLRGDIVTNVWNRLYRRELFERLRFLPGIYHEDLEFSARLFPLTHKVVCIDARLYGYRKRSGSILSTPKPKLLEDRIQVIRLVYASLKNAGMERELATELQAMAIKHLGYYGMKDLVRSPKVDWAWFDAMKECLVKECGVTSAGLKSLPLPAKARKWAGLALGPTWLGRIFLAYQHWRAHRA